MDFTQLKQLDDIISALRGKNGCPWDKKQTPASMALYLIEETHELLEAIESEDTEHIKEELGDVLFLIIFIARMFDEKKAFNINDAAKEASRKLIRRHPHVFGDGHLSTDDEVKKQWDKIKKKENNHKLSSVLDSVPLKLPALMRAYRISERAARTGFDWNDIHGVMDKVQEEWDEFKNEMASLEDGENGKAALEMGDILFTLVNVARFAKIHPETALSASNAKFEKRFRYMEEKAKEKGMEIDSVPSREKEALWEEAKKVL